MTHATTITGSSFARGRRGLGQLWQVPTFLVGLLAFIGVAGSTPWRHTPQEREFDALVAKLRQSLESDDAANVLVAHAENVQLRVNGFPSRAAEAHYLIGSAYYRQAQNMPPAYAKDVWPRALEHLDKAESLGVADKDRPALQYRLGFTLYQQNTDVPRALDLMTLAVEKGADQPLQGYQTLIQAHLKRTPANLDSALAASRRILDLTPERDVEALALAHLQRAELLMRKELRHDAIKELERVSSSASPALRVKARLLQARCSEEDGNWAKAIPIWQELLADAAHVEGGKGRIAYQLGWCYQQLEPPNTAETLKVWADALKVGGKEGQAAGLQLGRLRLAQGVTQVDQALADWKLALEKVSEPKDFHNPYLKIEEVRDWFDQAILRFQEGQDPEKTQAVAELYRKIAPGGGAELKIAQAAEAVAAQLAEKLKLKLDNVTPEIVHAQYGRAGDAFEQAAKVRPEADSLEPLWRSAQCYIAGKHVARAEQILSQFVKQEMNETRLAEGWCLLGDLYRGEKKKAFAHDAYLKCIQFPDTPFAYRSRYFLALEEEIDNKNLEKARAILHDNLVSSGDVERQWQEKSLFKMASLLMKMKNYGEAHFHLKECLRLYPENPNTLLAREQLGDCYRRLAELERAKEYALRDNIKPGMPEESRLPLEEGVRQQRKTRIDTLSQAVRTYQDLADELEKTQARAKSLSNLEQVLLLRAWVGIGDCHLDGEEYDQSLRVFQTLQSKYRRTLEGFYASHRICYTLAVMEQQPLPKKQVDQVREQAKESIRLLTEDLKSLPNEHEMFRLPGVSSREDWLRWAEDTQRKLLAPPKNESGLPAFR